jgi:toxin ParE1/3/4
VSRFILDPVVSDELHEIWIYIAQDNPGAAWQVVDAVFETFQTLSESPLIGKRVLTKAQSLKGVRWFPVTKYPNYMIFYRPFDDCIQVHHVFHGARDLVELLK